MNSNEILKKILKRSKLNWRNLEDDNGCEHDFYFIEDCKTVYLTQEEYNYLEELQNEILQTH